MMRKGQEEGFSLLTKAAIFVVIAVIVVLLYNVIFKATADVPAEEVCRKSINMHSLLLRATQGEYAAGIECEPTVHPGHDAVALVDALAFCRERWDTLWRAEKPLYAEHGIYCNPCGFLSLKDLHGFDVVLEQTSAPSGMMNDYLFPVEGTWQAAKPRFANLTAGEYAVLFYYIRDEAPVELPDDTVKPLAVSCILANMFASGSCTPVAAKGLDWAADWLREEGYYVSALVGHSFSTLAQAGSTGTVDIASWAGAIMLVPNEADAFQDLGCELVDQASPVEARDV